MAKVGDKIRIVRMDDNNGQDWQARAYNGKEGTITLIDSIGQLHGTWGGLAVNPECDEFTIIENEAKYSVFYRYGDEANDEMLTKDEAMKLAKDCEENGYDVIVAELVDDEFVTIYQTNPSVED